MANYKRFYRNGGTWFFTVNLWQRQNNDLLIREINLLRQSVRNVRQKHPFTIIAWVVLPEHMHYIWRLPEGDSDFSLRWRLIKSRFSRNLPQTAIPGATLQQEKRREIWQRHFWEHCIRDEADFKRHFDYIHLNPLKPGWAQKEKNWPYSTFHRYVATNIYPENWCGIIEPGVFGE